MYICKHVKKSRKRMMGSKQKILIGKNWPYTELLRFNKLILMYNFNLRSRITYYPPSTVRLIDLPTYLYQQRVGVIPYMTFRRGRFHKYCYYCIKLLLIAHLCITQGFNAKYLKCVYKLTCCPTLDHLHFLSTNKL